MQQPKSPPSGELSPQATEGSRPTNKQTYYLVTDRNGDLLRLTPEGLARWNAMGQPTLRGGASVKSSASELPSDGILKKRVSRSRYEFYVQKCWEQLPFDESRIGKINPYTGRPVLEKYEYEQYIGQRAFHFAYDELAQESLNELERRHTDLLDSLEISHRSKLLDVATKTANETATNVTERLKAEYHARIAIAIIASIVITFLLFTCLASLS